MFRKQDNRDELERKIALAQRRRKGMWSLGVQRISAADHKRGVVRPPSGKLRPVPVASATATTAGTETRTYGAKQTNLDKEKRERRRSNLLETVVTGLEVAAA